MSGEEFRFFVKSENCLNKIIIITPNEGIIQAFANVRFFSIALKKLFSNFNCFLYPYIPYFESIK